jgi:hypothetical protein
MLYTQTNLIAGRSEDSYPAIGDYTLTYDVSDAALKKATLANAFFNSTNLIAGRPEWATPNTASAYVLAYDDSHSNVFTKVTVNSLFWSLWSIAPAITNLSTNVVANQDKLVVWDADSSGYKQMPIVGLFPDVNEAIVYRTNSFFTLSSSTNIARTEFGTLYDRIMRKGVTEEFAIASNVFTNFAWFTGEAIQIARWVLVCKTNDAGYTAGYEVDANGLVSSSYNPTFSSFVDDRQVFARIRIPTDLYLPDGASPYSSFVGLTEARWRLKCYVFHYPDYLSR